MRIGKLRHRIHIQELTQGVDDHGGLTQEWATVDTVWGSIEPLLGREFLRAGMTAIDVTHRIIMRGYSALTTKHRLMARGGRLFNIVSVLNREERGAEYEIMAKEAK